MREDLIIIEAGRANDRYWRDLWASRELIWILAMRDISVRYKQSVLGISWALLRPLVTMTVFTIVFGKIAQLPSDGSMPYALMVLAGMVPWVLFSTALPDIANSLVSNSNLLGKVFFPRLVIPIASLSNAVLEFLICLVLLLVLMIFYGALFTWALVFLPLFAALALLASIGTGLWCAALNVRYRDVRFIIPFAIQAGMYLTPIGFSSQLVSDRWKLLFYMNPMVAVVDGFRWCVAGGVGELYWPGIVSGSLLSCVLLYLGLNYFRKAEKSFADVI